MDTGRPFQIPPMPEIKGPPKMKPISPKDVPDAKKEQMPDAVLEAFNELISAEFSEGRAVVKQSEAVALISKKLERRDWPTKWLNVEEIYRQAGWNVEYDKPGYNESYPATFTFTKKPTR